MCVCVCVCVRNVFDPGQFPRCGSGDTSRTFAVGGVDEDAETLIATTEDALAAAIRVCGPGVPYSKIGLVVENLVDLRGLCVCPHFIGHGIGTTFHCPPAVLHYHNDEPYEMRPGHVFTIEPAVNEGSPHYRILSDGWTAITVDGSRSAQAEHTVLITDEVRGSRVSVSGEW